MSVKTVTQAIEIALVRLEDNEVYLRELDTKYYLIDPLLRALNWDVSDPAQVVYEQQVRKKKGNIDYVLLDRLGNPAIYLEAKRADEWLTNTHLVQLRSYIQGITAGLAVLTNGTEWKIYDLSRPGRFDSERGKRLADIYFDLPDRFHEEEDWEEWEDDEEEWEDYEEYEEENASLPVGEVAKILYQYLDKKKHW